MGSPGRERQPGNLSPDRGHCGYSELSANWRELLRFPDSANFKKINLWFVLTKLYLNINIHQLGSA